MKKVNCISVIRLGGIGGFSLPGSRVQSQGEIALSSLQQGQLQALDGLFHLKPDNKKPSADAFVYRICRHTETDTTSIELHECDTPDFIKACVKDTLVE